MLLNSRKFTGYAPAADPCVRRPLALNPGGLVALWPSLLGSWPCPLSLWKAIPKKRWEQPKSSPAGANNRSPRGQQSPPGGLLGALWDQVGPRCPPRPLGGSWAALGAVLGRPWRLLGPSWASRKGPRQLPGGSRGSSGRPFCAVSLRWAPGGQKTLIFEHV